MSKRIQRWGARTAVLLVSMLWSTFSVEAQFPSFPPAAVTSTQDRDQMMWQLGLSFPVLPAKLRDTVASPNAYPSDAANPEGNWTDAAGHNITRSGFGLWNNYDDSGAGLSPGPQAWRVGAYTPIDLLMMKNGTTVSTPGDWMTARRPEILKDIKEQLWGEIPPNSILPAVSWSTTTSTGGSGNSAYKQRAIRGAIDISRYPGVRNRPQILGTLRTPSIATGPVPVMVIIGTGSPILLDTYWGYCSRSGWGVCVFDAGSLQPDNGAGLTSYLIGLCNKGNWRKPSDWGSLAAWSWGVSKLIDYCETDSTVDPHVIGVMGHSRFGKAAIVAMAYEPRLAIAFPSCAGSLGTKMNRRHWGQDLENSSWDQEYHWVAGNLFKWMGPVQPGRYLPRKIENCPVDAHSLLALCAPRPVFVNGGTQDTWTDPYGMYLACAGANPVYRLLNKRGLIMQDAKPQVDVGYVTGDIAFRYHTGGHTDVPDWPAFFQFAGKYFLTPTLSISTPVVNLDGSSNSRTSFRITSDTTWSISCSAPWLTIDPSSGVRDGLVVVAATGNATAAVRTAQMLVSAPGLKSQAISVKQPPATP